MLAKKEREAKRKEFWLRALQRRERSGLTVAAFCQKEGFKESAYYYWRREITRGNKDHGASRSRSPSSGRTRLAQVRLVNDREPTSIEIVAQNGLVVRVGESATTEHVRRILSLVNEIG